MSQSTPEQAARATTLLEDRKTTALAMNRAKVQTAPEPEPEEMIAFMLAGPNGEAMRAFMVPTGTRLFWDSGRLLVDVHSDNIVNFDAGGLMSSDIADQLLRELEATSVAPLPPKGSELL